MPPARLNGCRVRLTERATRSSRHCASTKQGRGSFQSGKESQKRFWVGSTTCFQSFDCFPQIEQRKSWGEGLEQQRFGTFGTTEFLEMIRTGPRRNGGQTRGR